jgi:hypothetical protein
MSAWTVDDFFQYITKDRADWKFSWTSKIGAQLKELRDRLQGKSTEDIDIIVHEATISKTTDVIKELVREERNEIVTSYVNAGKTEKDAKAMLPRASATTPNAVEELKALLKIPRPTQTPTTTTTTATISASLRTQDDDLTLMALPAGKEHECTTASGTYGKLLVLPVAVYAIDSEFVKQRINIDGLDSIITATPNHETYNTRLRDIYTNLSDGMGDTGAQLPVISNELCKARGIQPIPNAAITTAAFDGTERDYQLAEYIVAIPCNLMQQKQSTPDNATSELTATPFFSYILTYHVGIITDSSYALIMDVGSMNRLGMTIDLQYGRVALTENYYDEDNNFVYRDKAVIPTRGAVGFNCAPHPAQEQEIAKVDNLERLAKTQKDPTIYCDLDGVIVDFNNGIHTRGGDPHNQTSIWRTINADKDFFRNLDWTADGKELWTALQTNKDYRTAILTGASTASRKEQKQAWCAEHLGVDTTFYSCRSNLKAKYCSPGDILIDDDPLHRHTWEAAGGTFILHTSTADTLSELRNLHKDTPLQRRSNPPSKTIAVLTRRQQIIDDIIKKGRETPHKTSPTPTQRILHINAVHWDACIDKPVATVLTQPTHEWATESSKRTLPEQFLAMTKQKVQETATDLLTNLDITPVREIIKITTQNSKQDKNMRKFLDDQLQDIRRQLIRDTKLWTVATATTMDNTVDISNDEEPGKEQAVRNLLKAMKTYGEEEEQSAEDFHRIWTGETAEESFGPTATTLMN